MNTGFKYTNSNKRYHTYNYFLQNKFGCKVAKIPLNAGFTCPNIDGIKGYGGCTYCSSQGSGEFAGNHVLSLKEQFADISSKVSNKWGDVKYIPYFQSFSNTYAPLDVLKRSYEEVLDLDNVVGISIATRPDCISVGLANYLSQIRKYRYLTVELGLQTYFDETAELINRQHSYNEFLRGMSMLLDRGINVCVHIINGLPYETHDMMRTTVSKISRFPIHSIKIHLLHILRNTQMERDFVMGKLKAMEMRDYVSVVCDQLELLPPEVVIGRLTGDGKASDLLAPMWSTKKFVVLNEIDKEMLARNSYQGLKRGV